MTLNQLFPDFLVNGAIFSQMALAPWAENNGGFEMDLAYIGMWSGEKQVANFVKYFIKDGVLNKHDLAEVLWKIYGKQWKKMWDAIAEEYSPIDNYSLTETMTRHTTNDRDITENGSVNYTTDGTNVGTTDTTGSGTEKEDTTVNYGKIVDTTDQTDNFTYGFNSSEQVPTTSVKDTSKETQSGADTTNRNLTSTTTNKVTSNIDTTEEANTTTKDTTTDNQTEDETTSKSRIGNIGQNSYQELIRQELELRKWNFYKQVFADCDVYLVLSVFDNCISDGSISYLTVVGPQGPQGPQGEPGPQGPQGEPGPTGSLVYSDTEELVGRYYGENLYTITRQYSIPATIPYASNGNYMVFKALVTDIGGTIRNLVGILADDSGRLYPCPFIRKMIVSNVGINSDGDLLLHSTTGESLDTGFSNPTLYVTIYYTK